MGSVRGCWGCSSLILMSFIIPVRCGVGHPQVLRNWRWNDQESPASSTWEHIPFLSDSGTCPCCSPWTPQTHPINDKCNNPGKGSSSKCWHPWGWSRGSCYPLSSCTEWMLTLSQLSWWAEKGRKVLLTSLRFGFKRFVSAQGSPSGSAGRGDGQGWWGQDWVQSATVKKRLGCAFIPLHP